MNLKSTLLVAAGIAASMLFTPAQAATFVLKATTHDRFNGAAIGYDAVLRTGAATMTPQGAVYDILGASGTASYDVFTVAIEDAFGSFTLDNGIVAALDANFRLGDPLRGGGIEKGQFNFVAAGEVGGPIEALTITPLSAVPEPASWALLLLGFGGMGAVLRRRVDARRIRYA